MYQYTILLLKIKKMNVIYLDNGYEPVQSMVPDDIYNSYYWNFDRIDTKKYHRFTKIMNSIQCGFGNWYDFIETVLHDAEDGKKVQVKDSGKYYSAARFISYYYIKNKYRYEENRREKIKILQYCIHKDSILAQQCINNSRHKVVFEKPYNGKYIADCYDGCCSYYHIKKISNGRKFILKWIKSL